MKIETTTVMKPTHDNWYPNWGGNKVKVFLHVPDAEFLEAMPDYYNARVAVWGADDLGMDKDFYGDNALEEATKLFNVLTQELEFVNIHTVKQLGLRNA